MYAYKTDFSVAQTTPQSSLYIFLHWNTKKGTFTQKERTSGIRTTDPEARGTATYVLPHSTCVHTPRLVCIYTYIEIDVWEKLTKKRKQHLPLRDDASTAEAAPGRVGRDDQGEAHRANTTPNGGPHLELGLLLQEFAPCDWTTATALPAG